MDCLLRSGALLACGTAAILLALVAARAMTAEPGPTRNANPTELPRLEEKLAAARERAAAAVVAVAWEKEGRRGSSSGVVMTAEGHVVTFAFCHLLPGESVAVRMPDGRQTSAKVLGSYHIVYYHFPVLKLEGPGPWRHVPLGKSAEVKAAELCLSLGSRWQSEEPSWYDRQFVRIVGISEACGPQWLKSPHRLIGPEYGGGLIDLEGRLVGVAAPSNREDSLFIGAERFASHWDELIAGKTVEPWEASGPVSRTVASSSEPSLPASATLDERTRAALKIARPACVLIKARGNPWGWSGTIASADGYVVTCAHHRHPAGERVTVHLSDGRQAAAKVLGANPCLDVGLVKITDPGPWPFVALGQSATQKPGDPCVFLGYPQKTQHTKEPRLERVGQITADLPPEHEDDQKRWMFCSSFASSAGDSGGGVFDVEGRLIGVHRGANPGHQVRIEAVREQWELLADECRFDPLPDPGRREVAPLFRREVPALRSMVVEVLGDGERRALGTIVGQDGYVLTKASELYGETSCRLPDGRTLPAAVRRTAREHDLALLKLEATGLPVAPWRESRQEGDLCLVAAPMGKEGLAVGTIAGSPHATPQLFGWLCKESLRDGDGGVEIVDSKQWGRYLPKSAIGTIFPLRPGDVVTQVEDHPTPSVQALSALLAQPKEGLPLVIPGDPVRVRLRRGGQELTLRFPLPSDAFAEPGVSWRRSHLPCVLDSDLQLTPETCGGPVVDREGCVAGIAIACGYFQLYVIPAEEAKKVAQRLMAAR